MMPALSRRQFLSAALAWPAVGYRADAAALETLGASTACLAGLSLHEAISTLHRLGFGALEMIMYAGARHSVGEIPGFAYDRASVSERDAVFSATRRFRHISAHLPFQDVQLFSSVPSERRAGIARLQSAIDGVAFLRGEMAVMHLGWPAKGKRFRDIWQPMVDTLRSLGDYAAGRDVKLGIETMQPDSVRDYSELIEAADHDSVGAVIDTGHIRGSTDIAMAAERRDSDEARARFNDVLNTLVTITGRNIFHLHVSDVRRSDWADHREIGSGIVDFPRLFTSLRQVGFRGLYVLELEEPDTIGALERSRAYVGKFLGGALRPAVMF